jgi:hypothetical protein
MNWYRFRIELSAWAVKTSLCVLTAVIMLRSFTPGPEGASKHYSSSMRWVAENEWIFPVGLLLLAALMWLCYYKTMENLRADKRYGDR